MEKIYKIKLGNERIQKIYNITDNKDKQDKLMSVLSYLIKYTDTTTNKLTKSLNRLYTMYIRLEYRKITRSYFYKLVDQLKEYKLFGVAEDKLEDKTEDKKEVVESSNNTSLEDNSKKHNNLITNNTNTYTLDTAKAEKVAAIDLVEDVFKNLKVKSKDIKQMVIAKLQNVKLDAAGAIAYIIKVVIEKTEQYNIMRNNYAAKVAESKRTYTYSGGPKGLRFNNFEPRQYDYNKLENKLLGWE